ncbi:hypothetical protein CYPRO_0363 [Cyclonatronum proteinivorum]|uniref:Uncharacterized protein n=1 Tax=Cyclonatronum proteinivorum TaxID=1457365 RepID=A0A345UGP9_9BACT|nr:hypothetical protein CYPRO_0363 [Cyclonatronum proteinivorum]
MPRRRLTATYYLLIRVFANLKKSKGSGFGSGAQNLSPKLLMFTVFSPKKRKPDMTMLSGQAERFVSAFVGADEIETLKTAFSGLTA